MIIRRAGDLRWSDVTPKNEYLNRRRFLGAALGAAAFGLGTARAASKLAGYGKSKFSTSEKQTPYQAITTYNNYYEFGT
ncbi:MAG TPA: mononuclear molybdenum enzyme YedY, partial [Solibacterales bacterium]|nr:mononuclear molybdenum enzyme YedY [Bryobacterales bacterium]